MPTTQTVIIIALTTLIAMFAVGMVETSIPGTGLDNVWNVLHEAQGSSPNAKFVKVGQ